MKPNPALIQRTIEEIAADGKTALLAMGLDVDRLDGETKPIRYASGTESVHHDYAYDSALCVEIQLRLEARPAARESLLKVVQKILNSKWRGQKVSGALQDWVSGELMEFAKSPEREASRQKIRTFLASKEKSSQTERQV